MPEIRQSPRPDPVSPGGSRPDGPRIVLFGHLIGSEFGGEGLLPCQYFRVLLGRGADVWLLAPERSAEDLKKIFPDNQDRIVIVSEGWIERAIWLMLGRLFPLISRWLLTTIDYWRATPYLKRLAAGARACVLHQVNPVSPRIPLIGRKPEMALIVGPLNGPLDYPPAFRGLLHHADRVSYALGELFVRLLGPSLDNRTRASRLLVANKRTEETVPAYLRSIPLSVLPENGVDLGIFARDEAGGPTSLGGPRFAYVGALIEWKGVHYLLKAFAALPEGFDARLEIVGDGIMRHKLERMAEALGIAEHTHFHGHLGHGQIREVLKDVTALVLPSMRECGGAVMLEAMAMSRPVVATAWGGALDYLDETCGILVEPSSATGFVENLTQAMIRLSENSELARKMGEKGRLRVEEQYDWEGKVDRIMEIYLSAAAS